MGQLFFLMRGEERAGAAALLEEDDRWDGDRRYLYIHHLATKVEEKGAGDRFLSCIQEYARSQGKKGIRLDCQVDNQKLHAYYERHGYKTVGKPFAAGDYIGIRKVLELGGQ